MNFAFKTSIFLTFFSLMTWQLNGQNDTITPEAKFKLEGYGVVNYYKYDWETIDKKDAIDPERLNLYLFYNFSPAIQFKSEIEFEHGGTGSTLSFDPLEEFGEFEYEVEKGGQVVAEQINVFFKLKKHFNVRIGKMRFYMGNASKQDRPREYFTAFRSEIENTILPLGWYETGIELSGDLSLSQNKFPHFSYKLYLVSGLDNTGFSSANWVRKGYQTRFETINAESLAYALRFDYIFEKDSEIGLCLYANNASPNRPKNDVDFDSWLTYGDIHFTIDKKNWRARTYGMIGNIQNSDALSKANRNLSNNLNVKRSPVAKSAAGAYAEFAYNFSSFFSKSQNPFFIFARGEWYDAMYKTAGDVADNPRYERSVLTAGINYFIHKNVVFKSHYSWRRLGSGEKENTFATGIGFDF